MENSPPQASAEAHDLSTYLRERFEESGLSIRQLAAELGVERGTVYAWLGKGSKKARVPSGIALIRILAALGVRLEPAPPETLAPATLQESLSALASIASRQATLQEGQGQLLEALVRDVRTLQLALDASLENQTAILERLADVAASGSAPAEQQSDAP